MSVQDDIRRYITDELGWGGNPAELTEDLDLIEHRVVDSLSIVELSAVIEQWYGVPVDATELLYDNFHSIGAIAGFVERKKLAVP